MACSGAALVTFQFLLYPPLAARCAPSVMFARCAVAAVRRHRRRHPRPSTLAPSPSPSPSPSLSPSPSPWRGAVRRRGSRRRRGCGAGTRSLPWAVGVARTATAGPLPPPPGCACCWRCILGLKVRGEWMLHVRLSDGQRLRGACERRRLTPSSSCEQVHLSDNQRLRGACERRLLTPSSCEQVHLSDDQRLRGAGAAGAREWALDVPLLPVQGRRADSRRSLPRMS